MENEEKLMTGEESLKIITDMISKTKVNIRQSSFHLLFWGWLIFVCSLSEYLLWHFTDYTRPYYIWFFVIPGTIVSFVYGFVTGRKAKVHTYADYLYVWTWFGFLIASLVLFIVRSSEMENFALYMLILAGFPTFMSGIILRFKPLIAGGICFWIIAIIVNFAGPGLSPLGMPVAVLFGYLIPGYILKNKIDHDKV
jgi:uncharacterized membrane protein